MKEFTSIVCACSACGKEQCGMMPGQPHRHCPKRSNQKQVTQISPSEGGQNRTGKKLVENRGTWVQV